MGLYDLLWLLKHFGSSAELLLANTWRRRQGLLCSGQDVPSSVVTLHIVFL